VDRLVTITGFLAKTQVFSNVEHFTGNGAEKNLIREEE